MAWRLRCLGPEACVGDTDLPPAACLWLTVGWGQVGLWRGTLLAQCWDSIWAGSAVCPARAAKHRLNASMPACEGGVGRLQSRLGCWMTAI